MNAAPKFLALTAALLLSAAIPATAATPAESAAVSRWNEKKEFKILKVYAASDGIYQHRAYAIEWKGQEVIAADPLALTKKRSDDTILVLTQGDPYPQNKESFGLLNFTVVRPKNYPPALAETAPTEALRQPPLQEDLRVTKVYSARDGAHIYYAYAAEWRGQEVIVRSPLGKDRYNVGDTIPTLIMRLPFPGGAEKHGLLSFMVSAIRAR